MAAEPCCGPAPAIAAFLITTVAVGASVSTASNHPDEYQLTLECGVRRKERASSWTSVARAQIRSSTLGGIPILIGAGRWGRELSWPSHSPRPGFAPPLRRTHSGSLQAGPRDAARLKRLSAFGGSAPYSRRSARDYSPIAFVGRGQSRSRSFSYYRATPRTSQGHGQKGPVLLAIGAIAAAYGSRAFPLVLGVASTVKLTVVGLGRSWPFDRHMHGSRACSRSAAPSRFGHC